MTICTGTTGKNPNILTGENIYKQRTLHKFANGRALIAQKWIDIVSRWMPLIIAQNPDIILSLPTNPDIIAQNITEHPIILSLPKNTIYHLPPEIHQGLPTNNSEFRIWNLQADRTSEFLIENI